MMKDDNKFSVGDIYIKVRKPVPGLNAAFMSAALKKMLFLLS